ncbi:MAG: glycosyltransferase family 4 protein [Nostoc sp.]|uniref:glycosyltransferase family 4 protein n=1 Tax=Nostoc sp. TaxID=1180 RepID=UPI002FFCD294
MKKFISIQTGARRNYVVPAIIEKAGLLEALYTDLCADSGLGAVLDSFCPHSLKKGLLSRFLSRRVPSELKRKVHTFDLATLRYLARQKLAGNNQVKQHQALTIFNQEFGQAMIDRGFGQATHIYSMFGEGSNFIESSKQQGLKVITELYISFLTHKIVQNERQKYPFLESITPSKIIDQDYDYANNVCKFTDIFIVPSYFVLEGLKEFNVPLEKCHIVPYTVKNNWFDIHNYPTQGRILFVGTAELRKGIHILGMASQKLSHRNYEFRIAGGVSDVIRNSEITQKLHFLGRVPRTEIQQEYALGDIFVLPSLAEGSASVVYEALAAGLPVITTEAAGSVIRDGIEGFIVLESDADSLADRIEELVENRELRDRMAVAARERAKNYTWDTYAERLLSVFQAV